MTNENSGLLAFPIPSVPHSDKKTAGFRAEASSLNWAVVGIREDGKPYVVADGTWKAPKTYTEPESLSWFRESVLRTVSDYSIKHAGVKYPEFGRRSPTAGSDARLRLEGVVVQALQSNGVLVATGPSQSVASRLGSKSAKNFKTYIEQENFRGLDLSKRSDERREAILVALSVQERCDGN